MSKFKFGSYKDLSANRTARVGTAADLAGRLVDNDRDKFVKYVGDSRYALCAAGDPIEGTLDAIESATQDGYAIGTINTGGTSRLSCICDGLQATPGTGTIAVGDFVVTGTVVAAGTALTTGPKVCKATFQPATASVAAGTGVSTITLPITLAGVTAADVLTTYTPGYKFKILKADFAVTTPVTTAAKAAALNLEIGTTNLTGGVVSLTSANCTPLGAVVAGTAVTAANTGTSTDTISVEASAVTAFVEGEGVLTITIQNLDTVDALTQVGAISNGFGWRVTSLGSAGAVGDTCIIEKVR